MTAYSFGEATFKHTIVTDPLGRVTRTHCEAFDRMVKVQRQLGAGWAVTAYAWDWLRVGRAEPAQSMTTKFPWTAGS